MAKRLTRRQLLNAMGGCLSALSFSCFWPIRRVAAAAAAAMPGKEAVVKLPMPEVDGAFPLAAALKRRRTIRGFADRPVTMQQLAQLLWAAQGITGQDGFKRAAPSAGALYPMDVYAVVGAQSVPGLPAGVYHYTPARHALSRVLEGDMRNPLARAALSQGWMAGAAVNFVITAEYDRITGKYGRRGVRYAMIEAGHIGQNIFLQAEALQLGAGIVGAFDDGTLSRTLGLPARHEPLLVMPVGPKA